MDEVYTISIAKNKAYTLLKGWVVAMIARNEIL
jgi:hypothetical protein